MSDLLNIPFPTKKAPPRNHCHPIIVNIAGALLTLRIKYKYIKNVVKINLKMALEGSLSKWRTFFPVTSKFSRTLLGLNMPKNMISEKRKLAKIDAFI